MQLYCNVISSGAVSEIRKVCICDTTAARTAQINYGLSDAVVAYQVYPDLLEQYIDWSMGDRPRGTICGYFLLYVRFDCCLGVKKYSKLQLRWAIRNKRCELAQHVAAATATSAASTWAPFPKVPSHRWH